MVLLEGDQALDMTEQPSDYIEANRAVWEGWTERGFTPGFHKIQPFKSGEEILQPFEIEELGDVTGKSLLHLQCHFGLDTLAWARHGAVVTGMDFSERSIGLARELAQDLGFPDATFVRSDVYLLEKLLEDRFDIVYTSFGVLAWLPDLASWAQVIAHFLKPGGTFYIAEYHPFPLVFDDEGDIRSPQIKNRYFPDKGPTAYPGDDAGGQFTVFGWPYTLGGVVTALATAGLRLEFLHEFPFSESPHVNYLVPTDDGTWSLPAEIEGDLPLLFSIKATKPDGSRP